MRERGRGRYVSRWFITIGAVVGVTSCSDVPCPTEQTVGPTVAVEDSKTHRAICDANVLILVDDVGSGSGSAAETVTQHTVDSGSDRLPPLSVTQNVNGTCVFLLTAGFVTPHVYSLQVSRSGYVTETVSNVHDTAAECSLPAAQMVVVSLSPVSS